MKKTRTICVVNSLLFNVLMFDIDNFAGKFPAKNSLSIAHSIDDFLMPHCLTRFITNVENFLSGRFLQSDSAFRYDMIKLRIYFEYVLEKIYLLLSKTMNHRSNGLILLPELRIF